MKFNDIGLIDYETKTAIIMRDGIYTYLAGEFPFLSNLPQNKRLRVYRSKYAVQKAFERFKALGKIPVIFEHPSEDLDLHDFSQGYGYEPELVEEGLNLAIKCKLKLTDASKMAYDELGIREISCGWSGEFVENTDKGQPYDYEQTFEEFNHIALVPQGRCGGLCSIKDSKGAKIMIVNDEQKSLFEMANKCTDEIANITKQASEIEDSHAEGLLTAIKGLKDTIKGLEAFANIEHKEEGEEKPVADEEKVETEVKTEEEKVADAEETEEKVQTEIVEKPEEEKVETAETEKVEEKEEEKEVADEEIPQEKEAKEELGIADKCKDAKPTFKDAKTRFVDAMNLGMAVACKRWHDVLPLFEKGLVSFGDIKPTDTPCDIKRRFVEERTGKRINDSKELAIAFDIASKISFADAWKMDAVKDAKTIIDEKANEINSIGVKNK